MSYITNDKEYRRYEVGEVGSNKERHHGTVFTGMVLT